MKVKIQLLLALLAGVAIGMVGIELARKTANPPAYMVLEYEITDRAGFEDFIKSDEAIHSPRIVLAHANGFSLSGEQSRWIDILQFPSVEDALAFASSPEFTALRPILDKSTKWRLSVVKGRPTERRIRGAQ